MDTKAEIAARPVERRISPRRPPVAGVLAAAVALAVTQLVERAARRAVSDRHRRHRVHRPVRRAAEAARRLAVRYQRQARARYWHHHRVPRDRRTARPCVRPRSMDRLGWLRRIWRRGDRDRGDRSAGGPLVDGRRRGARHRRRHRDVRLLVAAGRPVSGPSDLDTRSAGPSRLSALLPRMECRSRRGDGSRRGSGSRVAGQVRVGHGGCRATRAGEDGASAAVATVHRSRPDART